MKDFDRCVLTGLILYTTCLPIYAAEEWITLQPSVREVTISGFTRARSTMQISTEVAGKVERVYADVGDVIPAEGKFACLDDTFVKIDIESAQNDIAQHAIDIDFFKKQVSRHQKLVATKSAPISLLDELKKDLGNSQRALESDRLRTHRLQELLHRHCVYVPAGWRVMERYVEPGQWIDVGAHVAKVGDFSQLLVPLALSTQELIALKTVESDLKVYLSELDQEIPATIELISPAFDEQSHKTRVDLQLDKGLPVHRGGLRVELSLDLPDKLDAFLIPKQALDERFEEIWLQRKDGKELRVTLLSYPGNGFARITSPEIKTGDQFKVLHP